MLKFFPSYAETYTELTLTHNLTRVHWRKSVDRGRRLCGSRLCVTFLFLLLAPPVLHALGAGKPLREYGQQSWQSDSGLPQNTVRAIIQTRDGYLWIGTEAGVVRFDGVEFRVFDTGNTPALHSNFIRALKEDAAGSLWIATSEGLVCERGGAFVAYGQGEGLPAPVVLGLYLTRAGGLLAITPSGAAAFSHGRFAAIAGTESLALADGAGLVAEDASGGVWIAGSESVVRVDGNHAGPRMPLPHVGEIEALAVSASGEVWVGGSSGLVAVSTGQQSRTACSEGMPSPHVTSLVARADGAMWVGTSKGLALCLPGQSKAQTVLAGSQIERLFLDREGALWIATSEGIGRYAHGSLDLAARKPLLTGVLCIFEDREGSMWFGSDTGGLRVLRDQAFSTMTTEDGLSASLVRAVFEDHAGTLWIGTSGGGLDQLLPEHAGAGREVAPFRGKLPSRVILALAETRDPAGTYDLWVGTPEGLVRVRDGRSRVYTTADGLADDFVRSLYADRDGSLWVGTRNGLSHFTGGVFRSYSKLDGLGGDLVGAILRSRAGVLWVGTLGGLSRMSGDGFVPALARGEQGAGVLEGAITTLLEDSKGALWIGSNGSGLSRLAAGRLTTFPVGRVVARPANTLAAETSSARVAVGLPAAIFGMLEDGRGNLWLSSRTGVDRVSIADLDAYRDNQQGALPVLHYGVADGMRISEASGGGHPAAWRAHDGCLWFATLDGVAVVYPASDLRNLVPPPVAIEQVTLDDQVVPALPHQGQDKAMEVAPGRARLTIHYAGLSFVAPGKVRYRYMLRGFDKDWIDAGARRTAFYTNVPPGFYSFLVLAANNDGVWSVAPAEVRFHVEPFFYQTAWFYALLACALLGSGYGIYRWRVLTVEAQYQAVLQERNRIAREIHDTLAQGYVAVAVQLELAERLLSSSTDAAREQLKRTREMVRESLAEARSSIWNLRSQADAETLPSLLAAHLTALTHRHKAAEGSEPAASGYPALRFAVHGAYRPLARTVEGEVQRIAQEAVANAVTHAAASMVLVTLSYEAQLLELRVSDDGRGMSPAQHGQPLSGHFGLQGMRERAARIDAQLEIDSAPGCGTTVLLRVHLQRAASRQTGQG